MKKIMRVMGVIGLMGVIGASSAFAYDRNTLLQETRVISNSNFTYNINSVNISLNSGPVFVGSTDKSLPAYQQIAQITAQIQALKDKLKNFSPR